MKTRRNAKSNANAVGQGFEIMVDIAILDEHQGVEERGPAEEGKPYAPSDEEQKLIKKVMNLFKKAKKHRDDYDKHWLRYYKMFRGKQWPDYRPSWRHSEVINMIFQAVQSQVPLETDSRPKISFVPTEPSDTQFAEIMNQVCEADWEAKNWLMALTEVVYDKTFYGAGLSELCYDEEEDEGAGGIKYASVDPFYCYPDPDARDVNVSGDFFVYAKPWDVEKAKKRWPDKAAYIHADALDVYGGEKTDLGTIKRRSTVDQNVPMELPGQSYDHGKRNEVLVIDCWMKSEDTDEEVTTGEDGSIRYVQKLRYPKGRHVVLCNNIVLEDEPNPYEDGKFPFARCQNYLLPREFWGISEIEQLEGPQMVFNKLVSFALDVLTLMGNPIWVVDTTSGVDTDNLFNRPGDVIEKEPGSEIRRESGVQLQPFVLQLVDRLKNWFDQIAGATDVTRGVAPASVTAASAIENLQDAAQTRVRQKMRLLDMYLKNVGEQYASRVMQFYSAPRLFRLTNNEGVNTFFKFHVTSTDDGGKVARITPYVEDAGKFSEGPTSEYQLRGRLDVRASTGSGLPFAKAEKEQRLMKLFQLGIIDAEEVLKGMDYPNAELVLSRVRSQQQAAAPAPAAAQGGAA